MKNYFFDIANRLSRFSEKLDNTSLFIDKPWVLIDAESNYHKYIFKRNGELLLSINGQVQIGAWEYLAGAKSILIDRNQDKILLNHTFFDEAVMILKIDGSNQDLFVLANEIIIPDLNVRKYLQSIIYKQYNVITGQLKGNKTLEIYPEKNEFSPEVGMKATIDGENPTDGKYHSLSSGNNYIINRGKIFKITYPKAYNCKDGKHLIIEQIYENSISIGDYAYINDQLAPSGKYRLGIFNTIKIVNGVIKNKSIF